MIAFRVLVANEPPVYREVVAAALRALLPDAEVVAVDAGALDEEIGRVRPHLALASRLTERLWTQVPTWAVLSPAGQRRSEVGLPGERRTVHDLGLAGLLALARQAAELAAHESADPARLGPLLALDDTDHRK